MTYKQTIVGAVIFIAGYATVKYAFHEETEKIAQKTTDVIHNRVTLPVATAPKGTIGYVTQDDIQVDVSLDRWLAKEALILIDGDNKDTDFDFRIQLVGDCFRLLNIEKDYYMFKGKIDERREAIKECEQLPTK